MPDANETTQSGSQPVVRAARFGWLFPALRVLLVIAAGFLAWYVAGHWDRWTGAARYEWTDDAYTAGDLTPLSAKVSGYVAAVAVTDYQTVHKGDLIVQIDDEDYRAQLLQAEANLAAAQADAGRSGEPEGRPARTDPPGRRNHRGDQGRPGRYQLEADRQRALLQTRIAGTEQKSSRPTTTHGAPTPNWSSTTLNSISRKRLLASLDVQGNELEAKVKAAEAQLRLARNNMDYTHIVSPADGMVGLRQVRPGQFVNVGTQVISVVPLPRSGSSPTTRRHR